jgi:hypothetical protein
MRNDLNVFRVIPIIILKHNLIDCVNVPDARQTFYNVNTLSDWFTNIAWLQISQMTQFEIFKRY